MRKFISVLLALMMVLSLTNVAFNAYSVIDDGVITASEAVADYENNVRVYFQMPNGKTGNTADNEVTITKTTVDEETGESTSEEVVVLLIYFNPFILTHDSFI